MILLLPACRVTPATAALLALGGAAWADAPEGDAIRSVESWGTTTPAFVSLEPAEDHPADLLFVNELTLGNPLQMSFVLSINGLRVDVEVTDVSHEVRPPTPHELSNSLVSSRESAS